MERRLDASHGRRRWTGRGTARSVYSSRAARRVDYAARCLDCAAGRLACAAEGQVASAPRCEAAAEHAAEQRARYVTAEQRPAVLALP